MYMLGCNYFWMLCEGIYLHTLIVVAVFAEEQHLHWYYLLGWGEFQSAFNQNTFWLYYFYLCVCILLYYLSLKIDLVWPHWIQSQFENSQNSNLTSHNLLVSTQPSYSMSTWTYCQLYWPSVVYCVVRSCFYPFCQTNVVGDWTKSSSSKIGG